MICQPLVPVTKPVLWMCSPTAMLPAVSLATLMSAILAFVTTKFPIIALLIVPSAMKALRM